jgi:hypothetical protein
MVSSLKIAPPYSIVLIDDPSGGTVPEFVHDTPIMATDSCIAVTCWPEVDGKTEFVMGDAKDVDPGARPAFEGHVKTPNKKIILETVERNTLLEMPTSQLNTKVRIWTNRPKAPDKIIIGVG